MEALVYARVIWKRIWLVLAVCLIGVNGAVYTSLNQPVVYSATTVLMLNPAQPSALLPYRLPASTIEGLAATYGQFIKTRSFAALVAQAMNSEISPESVASSVSSGLINGTSFFQISARSRSPELAQRLANTTAKVFIQENLARQKARLDKTSNQNIQGAQAKLDSQKSTLRQRLEDELKLYQDQTAVLRQKLAGLESQPQSEDQLKETISLRQQLLDVQNLSIRAMTALVDAESKDASLNTPAPIDTAEIIDEAPLPPQPSGPRIWQVVLYALVFSLGAGVAGAFLLEYLDYTFKSADELDQAYGTATLGIIGRVDPEIKSGVARERIVAARPRSLISEAFRVLRTNIQFASLSKPIRVLTITSAAPSEGKSFTASNLAIAIAQTGKRVILVDADMRRPSLHSGFDLPNEFGLSSLALENSGKVVDGLRDVGIEGLRILTSGPIPPNPAEILGLPRMDEIIRELSAEADLVIFDTPPTTVVADAAVLATKTDAVLHVVKAGITRRDLVMKGKDSLDRVGARILGPVLNMVRVGDTSYYHGYHYYYYGGRRDKKRSKRREENASASSVAQ